MTRACGTSRPATLLAVTAAVLVAAGCGGSSGKKAFATKAGYAAALNAICAQVNADQVAVGQPTGLPDVVDKGPKLRDLVKDGIARARRLRPPGEIEAAVDEFLSLSDQEVAKLADLIAAAKDNDQARFQQVVQELTALDARVNADARRIGAPDCGSGR